MAERVRERERERERVRETETEPSEAHGDSPSENIAFALLQEPPALGHKEGEKGNYGILYQAGQRHRIFQRRLEREKLQCCREGGEEKRKKRKKESLDGSGERPTERCQCEACRARQEVVALP